MAQSLSNLPIGAKVKFGRHSINGETAQDIIWLVVAKNHSGYPSNSITLHTASIIDLRCFDDPEPANADDYRQAYGNNRYSVSNIDQWLNANGAGGSWYSAQHAADAPPTQNETNYVNRPGFLYHLTDGERAAILPTTIRVVKPDLDGGGYEDIIRNIFLPSVTEIGLNNENNIAEGNVWGYYMESGATKRASSITNQVYTYSKATNKPIVGNALKWWTRTPSASSTMSVREVSNYGAIANDSASIWLYGIRPALNLSSTLAVSDTTDSDGCYTLIWNRPPNTPTITAPDVIYESQRTTISWSASDPDGDELMYVLESYSGPNNPNGAIHPATKDTHITYYPQGDYDYMRFRVKAIDPSGAESGYADTGEIPYISNAAPVISGADSNLGVKNNEFSQSYTVSDADNTITIQESIDGEVIRSYVVTGEASSSVDVTGETWLKLANGSHTLTITANDTVNKIVTRTYQFTKSVDSIFVETKQPIASETMPIRIKLTVVRSIPSAAKFKVEVCNNGYDNNPTWEDCTSSVTGNAAHIFTNTTKTATQWGVKVRVTVERNGTTGACYITSIGGNFE